MKQSSRTTASTVRQVAGAVGAATAVVVAGVAAPTEPAGAHHAWGWSQDNTHVEYARTISLIGTPGFDAATWGGNNMASSELDVFYIPQWSDVEASIDLFMAFPQAGRGGCVSFWGPDNRHCDLEIVQFAGWTTDGVAPEYNLADWKWLGCHESGHAAGLGERPDQQSCMWGTRPVPMQNHHMFLTAVEPNSDIGEINWWTP